MALTARIFQVIKNLRNQQISRFVIIDDLPPSETPVLDANEHLDESEVKREKSNENEKASEEGDYLDAIRDKRRKSASKR